jgi:hypothetical protein
MQEYQELAMHYGQCSRDQVLNGCLGLISKAGEVVEEARIWRHPYTNHNAKLTKEILITKCGRVLWHCAELATGLQEDLYSLYQLQQETFYQEVHNMNSTAAIETAAARLAIASNRPFIEIYDCIYDLSNPAEVAWQKAQAEAEIVGIMVMVRDILEKYCDATILDAMERNIFEISSFIVKAPGE